MSKEIKVLVERLPKTPGWVALSETEKQWLQEQTSEFVDEFRQAKMKAVSACVRIGRIRDHLVQTKSPMQIKSWMESVLPSPPLNESVGTGWNMLNRYDKLRKTIPDHAMLFLAQFGIAGMNNVGVNRLLPVLEKNPPPNSSDPKVLEPWTDKIGRELKKGFSEAAKTSRRKLDPDDAIRASITFRRRLIRRTGISDSAGKRALLKKELGYMMELEAIGGTVATERVPVPDDYMPQRGRPRGSGKHKDA